MIRAVELFAGIGGFAAAASQLSEVALAIDIDMQAKQIYEANFQHPYRIKSIESLDLPLLQASGADFWWMSPPCQPFTKQGKQRDLDDSRCDALKWIINAIVEVKPNFLALENVPGFETSRAHELLVQQLVKANYHYSEFVVCPSEFGIANQRRRYYLVATQQPSLRLNPRQLREWIQPLRIADVILPAEHPLSRRLFEWARERKLQHGTIHVVGPDDSTAVTKCFTAAYGRSFGRSGSYLKQEGQIRPFAPEEISQLLGFDRSFCLPDSINLNAKWKRVGNSISVPIVRAILQSCLGTVSQCSTA